MCARSPASPTGTTFSRRGVSCGRGRRPSWRPARISSTATSESSSEGGFAPLPKPPPRRDCAGEAGARKWRSMTWIDPSFPRTATPSDLVGRVLGLNPGWMTGPGTNTYLVGRREPILIDTGAGVPEYMDVLASYLRERGWRHPSRVILTHRHVDHLGGVPHLRERFPGLSVSKLIFKDTGLPEGTTNLQDGQ